MKTFAITYTTTTMTTVVGTGVETPSEEIRPG